MADKKPTNNTDIYVSEVSTAAIDDLAPVVDKYTSPSSSHVTSATSITRTYTPPLMGTSARAAKRRIDSDSGAVRIEGTDTYNQHLQHHYQNVRQLIEDQQQELNVNIPQNTGLSFNAKRDYFEQRFKTPPPTYDAPPPQQPIQTPSVTVAASATSSSNVQDRTSSSSNESPSVDRVLEEAVELQKLSNINSMKNDAQSPLIIERTEEYQVFLDSLNHEIRRTPVVSHTSIVPLSKPCHATDLDQAQAQIGLYVDDHQAIKHLTRALQEHRVSTANEYKRLPSQSNQNSACTSNTVAPEILADKTNVSFANGFSVIDALINNPIGTTNSRDASLLSKRYDDILKNLRNPEYINSLKQPVTKIDESRNSKRKSKSKQIKLPNKEKLPAKKLEKEKSLTGKYKQEKKSQNQPFSVSTEAEQQKSATSYATTAEESIGQFSYQIMGSALSEQTPLIDPKEKKDYNKEKKTTMKSKQNLTKQEDYQVIDALLSSPISTRLPNFYLTKYHTEPPISQSQITQVTSPLATFDVCATALTTTNAELNSDSARTQKTDDIVPNYLAKVLSDIKSHHSKVANTSSNANLPPTSSVNASKEQALVNKQVNPFVNDHLYQQARTDQQPSVTTTSQQVEANNRPENMKPRIIYRYMDEYGRILKISSMAPSELREQPAQSYISCPLESSYMSERRLLTDDDCCHPLPQCEHHAIWHGRPKLPTTLTREDFELRDKRIPQISEQAVPIEQTVSPLRDHESRNANHLQQQTPRTLHFPPNQQGVKLAWLPLSYPSEQLTSSGAAGYDTDSTISERSTAHRHYEYGPNDNNYHCCSRPYCDDYCARLSVPFCYRMPPTMYPGGRSVSPEYGGSSRNYIEVFRGGDFRETRPSEIYSLPFNEQMQISPHPPPNSRHSRYDQYQFERFGTISDHASMPNPRETNYSNSLPKSLHEHNILPSSTVHASSCYTHRNPHHHSTVQSSPNPECKSYIRHSKSFDYRPLRTRLQREYKITPNLLVDEWDYPSAHDHNKCPTSTTSRSGISPSDDVFISSRTNKTQL